MQITIIRIEKSEHGTFGVMILDSEAFCVTLEPEDLNNKIDVSCIPEGQYICKRVASPKYGDTFRVCNVESRSHILFHAGNVEVHTKGCILLGQYFGKLRGDRAILNSGKTFGRFLQKLIVLDKFNLEIKSA